MRDTPTTTPSTTSSPGRPWRVRFVWALVAAVVGGTASLAYRRQSVQQAELLEAQKQLLEEKQRMLELEKTLSPEGGPRGSPGPGDFPPWYGKAPKPPRPSGE